MKAIYNKNKHSIKTFLNIFQLRSFSSQQTLPRVPAILTDIDGVVYRGGHEIGNSKFVIKTILNHEFELPTQGLQGKQEQQGIKKFKIPFALLTNGGGIPEDERAQYVNHVVGLDKEPNNGEDMILCHSPFRSQHLLEKYHDKFVLVSGLGDMIKIAKIYGYKKAIDIEELMGLYPELYPERRDQEQLNKLNDKKFQLLQRLKVTEDQLKQELKFDAIFLWSDAIRLECNLQIFSDLLISKDGRLGSENRTKKDPQHVKLYLTNPDLVYADKFKILRHGQGILIHCLKQTFKQMYGFDFTYTQYGKPERQFMTQEQGIEIQDFYMIGDNPDGDIEGANQKGWNSILVKTGVYRHLDEHEKETAHKAKFLVQDMNEAFELILKRENLRLKL